MAVLRLLHAGWKSKPDYDIPGAEPDLSWGPTGVTNYVTG